MVEDPLPVLLLHLDLLPALTDAPRCPGLRIAEDVRVPAHELCVHRPRDPLETAGAFLLQEQGEEVDLKEEVPELVTELRVVVTGEGRVSDLVGLLDRVRNDRASRLVAVPRALAPERDSEALQLD